MLTGVIFCDGDSLVSDGIRYVTGDDVSHCALLFEGDIVLHYRFLGFESMHLDEFKSIYDIKSILSPKEAFFVSPSIVINKNKKNPYDFFGMLYVGMHILIRRLFGINLPFINYWEVKRKRFCVEFCAEVVLGESGSMLTPKNLHSLLLARGYRESK